MGPSAWPRPPGGAWRISTSAPARSTPWSAPARSKRSDAVLPGQRHRPERLVTQGMYVQAGMPLLEVADLSTVWVDAGYLSV